MSIPIIVSAAKPPLSPRKKKLGSSPIPSASKTSAYPPKQVVARTTLGTSTNVPNEHSNTTRPSQRLPPLSPYAAVMHPYSVGISHRVGTMDVVAAHTLMDLHRGTKSHHVGAAGTAKVRTETTSHNGTTSCRATDSAGTCTTKFLDTGVSSPSVGVTQVGSIRMDSKSHSSASPVQLPPTKACAILADATRGASCHQSSIKKVARGIAALQRNVISHPVRDTDAAVAYKRVNSSAGKRPLESTTSENVDNPVKRVCLRTCAQKEGREGHNIPKGAVSDMPATRKRRRCHDSSDEAVRKRMRMTTSMPSSLVTESPFDPMEVC